MSPEQAAELIHELKGLKAVLLLIWFSLCCIGGSIMFKS